MVVSCWWIFCPQIGSYWGSDKFICCHDPCFRICTALMRPERRETPSHGFFDQRFPLRVLYIHTYIYIYIYIQTADSNFPPFCGLISAVQIHSEARIMATNQFVTTTVASYWWAENPPARSHQAMPECYNYPSSRLCLKPWQWRASVRALN